MRKIKKRSFIICSALVACILSLCAGFALQKPTLNVKASSEPRVTMLTGASVRKDEENPGIKFTADIENYSANGIQYGMIIIPDAALDKFAFNNDYIDVLNEQVGAGNYINKICTPYTAKDGDMQISLSITNILPQNYSLDFVGIAYAYDGNTYKYADIDRVNNVRSAAYVAQMALEHEENLTIGQKDSLNAYLNPGILVDKETYIDGLGDETLDIYGDIQIYAEDNTASIGAENAIKSGGKAFITKQPYSNITSITFDVKTGAGVAWWGLAFDADGEDLNVYDTSRILGEPSTNGEWWSVRYTILSDGYCGVRIFDTTGAEVSGYGKDTTLDASAYYIYFVAGDQGWSENIQIDNFCIVSNGTTYTDDFNAGVSAGLFNTDGYATMQSLVEEHAVVDGMTNVASLDCKGKDGTLRLITKRSYTNITKIQFDAKTSEAVDWWGAAISTDEDDKFYNTKLVGGYSAPNWKTFTYTYDGSSWSMVSSGGDSFSGKSARTSGYVHIAAGTGNWTENMLLDNFVIVADGVTYTDTFQNGLEGGLFDVIAEDKVSLTKVAAPVELSMDKALAINGAAIGGGAELVSAVTKDAYSGITEITFDAKATSTHGDKLWSLSFSSTENSYGTTWQSTMDGTNTHLHLLPGSGETADVWYSYKYVMSDSRMTLFVAPIGTTKYMEVGVFSGWVDAAYYVYVQTPPSTTYGGAGTILNIDNFRIVANGVTYTDNFVTATGGLFKEAQTNGGLSVEDKENSKPNYSLEYLLASGDLVDVLVNGKPVSLVSNVALDAGNMPSSMLILEGEIKYTLPVGGGIAVLLDDDRNAPLFLYAGENVLAYYRGEKLLYSANVSIASSYTLQFGITMGGKVSARINDGEYYGYAGVNASNLKVVLLNANGSLSINGMEFRSYSTTGVETLIYTGSDKIGITAYAPPTVENWGPGNGGNPNLINDQQYQWLAEAGFTALLALYEGRNGDDIANGGNGDGTTTIDEQTAKAAADALCALAIAEKYGLTYYVHHEFYNNFVKKGEYTDYDETAYRALYEQIFNNSEIQKVINSSAFGGFYLSDEPAIPSFDWSNLGYDYGQLDELDKAAELYKEYVQKGTAIVNLLPYAAEKATTRTRYEAYLNYYIENIAPSVGYISYDYYPFGVGANDQETGLRKTHLLNLELVAKLAKENGVDLRTYAYSLTKDDAVNNVRGTTSENELAFQIYSALAFGSKDITYYMYANHYNLAIGETAETHSKSLIDVHTGERQEAWYWAKNINNELHSFEDAYLSFVWDGVMYHGSNTQFGALETYKNVAETKHNRLTAVNSSANVLIGYFSDADGRMDATDGFLVMNYGDPRAATSASDITLTFANASRVLVYQDGTSKIYNLENGQATIRLEVGQGVFAIPYNGEAVPDVEYTVEHYIENADGTYTLAEEQTLTAQLSSYVYAVPQNYTGYEYYAEHEDSVTSATAQQVGTVLKVYYRIVRCSVTFDSNGGSEVASQAVQSGKVAIEPEKPERKYWAFVEWQLNGVAYDFKTPVTSDIELVAVWEENSRYADVYLDTDTTSSMWGIDVYFNTTTMAVTTFEGNNVIAYNYQSVGSVTNGDWMKFDSESSSETLMKEISKKKYLGFRVYAPTQGFEINTIMIMTASGANQYKYSLQKGWNEIIIDLEQRMARLGVDWATTEESIYRFGVCAQTAAVQQTTTLYFDDFYATNYDMANVIDFESAGDISRYEFNTTGSYGDMDYAILKHHFPSNVTTGVEVVEEDGRTALKLTKQGDYISFGFKMGNGAWFNSDVSDYSKLVICFKVDAGVFDVATNLGYASNTNASKSNEWVTYELDLTDVDQLTSLDFAGWGNGVVYIDYIQFVK